MEIHEGNTTRRRVTRSLILVALGLLLPAVAPPLAAQATAADAAGEPPAAAALVVPGSLQGSPRGPMEGPLPSTLLLPAADATAGAVPDAPALHLPLLPQSRRPRARRRPSLSNVGYVDNAIVGNQIQIRADRSDGMDKQDRAEFIYMKCGCYARVGLDPEADGPSLEVPEGEVPEEASTVPGRAESFDYTIMAEVALHDRFSVFGTVGYRMADVEFAKSYSGMGDATAGFKAALVARDFFYLTAQFRAYLPTGRERSGLGTGHASIEPSLLFYGAPSDRLRIEGEVKYWAPLNGSTGRGVEGFSEDDDYAGGVIRYGIGLGLDATPDAVVRFTPVVEVVGWSVRGGLATTSPDGTFQNAVVHDATGTNIVNMKAGARFGWGEDASIYLGYGFALTDEVWYDNIIRAEYRRRLW